MTDDLSEGDPAVEAVLKMMFGDSHGLAPLRAALRIVNTVDEARREAARNRHPSGLAALPDKIIED